MSDDHAGLRKAIAEILPEAALQRCYVHFLRNALDYLPRKADDDCLQELLGAFHRGGRGIKAAPYPCPPSLCAAGAGSR